MKKNTSGKCKPKTTLIPPPYTQQQSSPPMNSCQYVAILKHNISQECFSALELHWKELGLDK